MSKYFTEDELRCLCGCGQSLMNPVFMSRIDRAREESEIPWGVVSAYRCAKHDIEVKGEGNHPTGEALDIAANNSTTRFKIINCLIKMGFTRIGIGKTFIHVDSISNDRPQRVIWLY